MRRVKPRHVARRLAKSWSCCEGMTLDPLWSAFGGHF
jgi:hypothetical protein